MTKYIIPICNINKGNIYNEIIVANSIKECEEKLMNKFINYSDAYYYDDFLNDLDKQDILVGIITDIETL